jgi:soluble lytic murein transglycosylase-like protein
MQMPMKARLQLAYILLIWLALCAVPARAQLSSYIDDKGHLVFINADPPPVRSPTKRLAKVARGTPQQPSQIDTQPGPLPTSASPSAPKAAPIGPAALNQLVQQSAEKNHVDPALVRAVISTESNWNSSAVSPKGALGLMQLIPGTAQRLGVGNAFDPAQNVDAGTRYLSMLLERYHGDLNNALAAYNAGPAAVDRFGGVPNFPETRHYVQKVTSTYFQPGSARRPQAFDIPHPVYRTLDVSGRVVFSNE